MSRQYGSSVGLGHYNEDWGHELYLEVCPDCGAAVADTDKHDLFHDRVDIDELNPNLNGGGA